MLRNSSVRPSGRPDLALHERSKDPTDSSRKGTDGATLFWVHGLGESGLCFEGSMADERLADHRHIALDLAGYGKSQWAEQPLTLEQHALILASYLEQEEHGRVVLIGHSMGGVIGQILCERRADLVDSFVNVEGNLSIGDCGFSSRANSYSLEQFLEVGFDQLAERLFEEAAADRALRDYYPSFRFCDPRAYHLNSRELVSLSTSETLAARLAALELPTLYLFGDPGGAGARSQELLAEHRIEADGIQPAGHWPFLDQPTAFLDRLVSFLAKTSSRSAN